MFNELESSFRSGLIELLYQDPNIGNLARGMGMPVIDNSISTASLKWDKHEKKIVFAVNEDFIKDSDEEMIASIILHETEHLIFDHVVERIEGNFPNKKALHLAQECINNDIISDIYQLPLPEDAITGRELLNRNCSSMSTRQVYDIIMKQMPPGEDGPGTPDSVRNEGGGPSGNSKPQSSKPEGDGDGDDENDDQGEDEEDDHEKHGCGEIDIDDSDILDLEDYLKDLVDQAAKDSNKTVEEFMDEINNTKNSGYSPTGGKISGTKVASPARMNWNHLLAKINPKVLEAGKKRKVRYDWTKQNRRLISVFPQAIIPKVQTHSPNSSDKGDSLPVLVIALDLSGSIPQSLVKTLQGLLEDIPENLIKAYPCTWGSYLYPYEPGGQVANGGTEINLVVNYVKQIKEETNTDPYVLVITDGQFYEAFERPGKDWYFMAIDNNSYSYDCRRHIKDEDHLYHVKDFKI